MVRGGSAVGKKVGVLVSVAVGEREDGERSGLSALKKQKRVPLFEEEEEEEM